MFLTFGLFKTFMYNQNIDKVKEIFLERFYVKKSQVAKYIRVKYFAKNQCFKKGTDMRPRVVLFDDFKLALHILFLS